MKGIAEILAEILNKVGEPVANKKDNGETELEADVLALKAELDKRKIRYAKKATVAELQAKVDADNKKIERVAAAKAKKDEEAKAAAAVPPQAAPKEDPKPEPRPAIKMEEVKAGLIDFAKREGKEAAMNVLKSFDASKVSEVAVTDYEKIMSKLRG